MAVSCKRTWRWRRSDSAIGSVDLFPAFLSFVELIRFSIDDPSIVLILFGETPFLWTSSFLPFTVVGLCFVGLISIFVYRDLAVWSRFAPYCAAVPTLLTRSVE